MCARFCLDAPYSLAVGGRKNGFYIIDVEKLLPGTYVCVLLLPLNYKLRCLVSLDVVIQRFKKRDLLMPRTGVPESPMLNGGGTSTAAAGGGSGLPARDGASVGVEIKKEEVSNYTLDLDQLDSDPEFLIRKAYKEYSSS